jgi:putative intracellular protease/amidase
MRHLVLSVCLLASLLAPAVADEAIRLAIYDRTGESKGPTTLAKLLTQEKGFDVTRVSGEAIRDGALRDADVVIFPGGSGSSQAKHLEEVGSEEVRRFVRDGGGYVGICAGSYLASAEYPWSLRLINTRVIDRKHWARGTGAVTLSLSSEGRKVLNEPTDRVEVYYGQGPLLAPAIDPELPPYTPLAVYESEIAKNDAPSGVMAGTTAIAAAPFSKGRVLCISPHPEKTGGPNHMIEAAVRWVAAND